VTVSGSDTTTGGLAQIGFNSAVYRSSTGVAGGDASGVIKVVTFDDGLSLSGGSAYGSFAQVGHGGTNSTGNLSGNIQIDLDRGDTIGAFVAGGGAGEQSGARLGHGGTNAVGTKGGQLNLTALHVTLAGGSGNSSEVQIGHGGRNSVGSVTGEPISIESLGDMVMQGGEGSNSAVLVGHGGTGAAGAEFGGDLLLNVGGDLLITSGSGALAFSQIGQGGATADAEMSGAIDVNVAGSLFMVATNGAEGAYSKIGHGDELGFLLGGAAGSGDRSGDISVSTGSSLFMTDAMIGHVDALSPAASSGGITQIGVSRDDPSDPSGGILRADSGSEFAGADELRFYLPGRGNNRISRGAVLNGVSYAGARPDPSEVQGLDEYTITIVGDRLFSPNEHGNTFGTGPSPANAAGFAFYYDTIVLVDVEDPGSNRNPDGPATSPDDYFDFTSMMLDDRMIDDWLRELKREYSRYYPFQIYYEGYQQYGNRGQSTFQSSGPSVP
jgi:hypothetical protein